MAYTEIHPITATVHKAIAYICNPEKTDDKLLVSSFGCAPETAHVDFAFTRQNAPIQSPNLAYHMIQAFKPGEVSPEEAHKIGQELANRLLKDKYSYVISTHIDKGHVHNHIIFNAVDNEEYQHYDDCTKSYYHIRQLSDKLCREHNLSVIEEQSGRRGKTWYEWKQGEDSWKQQLRRDINKSVQITDTFEEFLAFMRAKGYQIKLGKYISFCPPGREKFVRGSVKSLGKNYTKEKIQERIVKEPKTKMGVAQYRLQYLISMSPEMLAQEDNVGMKRWMTKENLKRAAETYNQMVERGIHTLEELDEKIGNIGEQQKELKTSLKHQEQQRKELKEVSKYLKQYQSTSQVYKQYKKAYFKDRFFREHEQEIIIHGAAKNYLNQHGIDPTKVSAEKLNMQMERLVENKEKIKEESRKLQYEHKTLQKMKDNMEMYLQINEVEPKQVKTVAKEH